MASKLRGLCLVVHPRLRCVNVRKELRQIRQKGDALLLKDLPTSSGLQFLAGCGSEFRHSDLKTTRGNVFRLTERRDFKRIGSRHDGDYRHLLRTVCAVWAVEFSEGFTIREKIHER